VFRSPGRTLQPFSRCTSRSSHSGFSPVFGQGSMTSIIPVTGHLNCSSFTGFSLGLLAIFLPLVDLWSPFSYCPVTGLRSWLRFGLQASFHYDIPVNINVTEGSHMVCFSSGLQSCIDVL
jgi:hypothetical protein